MIVFEGSSNSKSKNIDSPKLNYDEMKHTSFVSCRIWTINAEVSILILSALIFAKIELSAKNHSGQLRFPQKWNFIQWSRKNNKKYIFSSNIRKLIN